MPTKDSSPEQLLQQRIAQLQETITFLGVANVQLQQKLSRQALLSTTIQAMRDTLVLDEVLQTTADRLHEALKVSQCLIFRPDSQHQMAVCHVSEVTDDRHSLLGVSCDFYRYHHQNLAQGRPIILCQIDSSLPPSLQAGAADWGVCAALIMPLLYKDSYMGAISLHQCDRPREWTEDDITFVQAIADQCAIAIQQAELYQLAQRELAKHQQTEAALQDSVNQIRLLVEQIPAIVFTALVDSVSTTTYVSSQIEMILDFTPEEFIADPEFWLKHLHPDDRDRILATLQQNHTTGEPFSCEYRMIARDGRVVWFREQANFLRDETNQPLLLMGVMVDITELKQAEAALRQSEEQFRLFAENSNAAIWITNRDNNKMIYLSPAYEQIWGYSCQSVYDNQTNFINTIYPEDLAGVLGTIKKLCQAQCVEMDYRIVRADGQVRWIRDRGFPIYNDKGEVYRMAGIAQDISDRKQAEQALQESELKFRTLAEIIPAAICIYQDTKICYVNPAATGITGYTQQELLTINFWNILHPDMWELMRTRGLARQRGEQIPSKYEAKIIAKNGEVRWIEIDAQVIEFEGKPAFLGTAFDITLRKQTEEVLYKRQQEFEALAENSPDIIARFDKNLRHIYVNRAVEQVTGLSRQSFLGKSNLELGMPELQVAQWQQVQQKVFATGQLDEVEFDFPTSNGTRYYQSRLVPEFAKDGSVESILSISRDITEQKQAEAQTKASLREKEVLLKEIHHRVKNNLQVVSSLLDLQCQQIQDPGTLEIFQTSQNRVKSMALIHEKLYQSPNLDRINFANYLENLTNHLFQTYAINPNNITLQFNLQDISLSIDTSVYCGLIVNELVANALKHGFPGQKQGQIWLELKSENNLISLEIRNDGLKLANSLEYQTEKSLGMQLVKALIEQIKGEMEIDRSHGTAFKITFYELNS